MGLVRPHGTLTLSLKDLEQSGIAGCMIRFPTLMLLERMLLSSALATNSHTMSTTAMLQESFMTSFLGQVPKWGGFTSTDGYDHSASKAERDGKFIGLMCDEDNQYDLSEDRAKAWVDQLKGEGFL